MNQVLIKPIITEQSMKAVDAGKFTFVVSKQSNKTMIKQAVATLFSVTVVSVSTSIVKGRSKRVGARRQEIAESGWKKAVVTLKKGEKIGWFEPGGDEQK